MTSYLYKLFINGSGIMPTQISLSESANATYIPTFGQKNIIASQGKRYNLSASYLLNVDYDPFLNLLPASTGCITALVNISNRSGIFHLSDFAVQTNGAQALEASVSLSNFGQLSGTQSVNSSFYSHTGFASILANATTARLVSDSQNINCNGFSYNYTPSLNPRYKLGDGYAYNVDFLGATEKISLALWTGLDINFHGSLSTNLFNGRAFILISGENNAQYPLSYTIPLSGFIVESCEETIRVNDIVRYNVTLGKTR